MAIHALDSHRARACNLRRLRRFSPALLSCALVACGGGATSFDASASDTGTDAGRDAPTVDAAIPYPEGDPLSWAVDAPGPFAVGYRSMPFEYLPAGQTEMRTSVLHIWYPTLAPNGTHPRYGGLFTDTVAWVDAPLAAPAHVDAASGEHRYPLLVHSHGWQAFGGSSWMMLDRFASHGFVVIAPEHTGSLLAAYDDPRPIAHYYERALDVTAAIDLVRDLPASDPLSGLVATDRAVLSGHSFGVHTVWATTGATFDVPRIEASFEPAGMYTDAELAVFAAGVRDPRIVAAIPIAGDIDEDFFGDTGHTSVSVPLLSITGSEDSVDGQAQLDQVSPPVDLTWIEIEGACHNSFAVIGLCSTITAEETMQMTNAYALSFARVHLLDDTDEVAVGIVDGTHVVDARVSFHRSPP
jgi:predicted dienelactone hydrolase